MGILPIPYVNYENPSWLVSLAATKITGAFGAATFNGNVGTGGKIQLSNSGLGFGSALTNGNAQLYTSATAGLIIAGAGSTSDLTVTNKAGGEVFNIPTGTTGVYFPATQAHIGYGGNSNYFGGATYFRPVAGGVYTAYVDGASGNALFEGTITAQSGRPVKTYSGYTTYYGDAGGYIIGNRFRGPSDTDLGFIGVVGTGDTLYSYIIGEYGDEIVTFDNVTKAATFNGAVQVNGFLNIGSTDCRMFRDSGSLCIESDATIFMRDTSTGVANWSLSNDGRTFSKVNVWHSDTDGNPRILYNGSGGATNFRGVYDFVSDTKGHGFLSNGAIVWGLAQSGNSRGYLSWDTDKAIIGAPLKLDIQSGGLTRYIAVNHEFNSVVKLGDYTVATLPSASANAGYECNVTDSSVTTFGSTVAGGGSSRVKLYSNGTNWTVQAA